MLSFGYLNINKSDYNLSEDTDLSCQVLRFKWYFVNKLCRLPDFFKYQPLRKLTGLFITKKLGSMLIMDQQVHSYHTCHENICNMY